VVKKIIYYSSVLFVVNIIVQNIGFLRHMDVINALNVGSSDQLQGTIKNLQIIMLENNIHKKKLRHLGLLSC